MIHKMKLRCKPFESIKSGAKTVEMRLFDEKRSQIAIGDSIEFTNVDTGEIVVAEVVDLKKFDNFDGIYNHYNKQQIGYLQDEIASPSDMFDYYSKSNIEKYGVLAIEIKVSV